MNKKILSLNQNYLFQRVYKRGKSYVSPSIVMYCLKNYGSSHTMVGITVVKKRGNAVVRNKIRRKIREAYRSLHPMVKDGYLLVFVARDRSVGTSVADLREEIYFSLKKAKLLSQ